MLTASVKISDDYLCDMHDFGCEELSGFLFGDEHGLCDRKLTFYCVTNCDLRLFICFLKLGENEFEFTNMQQISVIEFHLVLP